MNGDGSNYRKLEREDDGGKAHIQRGMKKGMRKEMREEEAEE